MKDGFVKVAAVTPQLKVCDIDYNLIQIKEKMKEAAACEAKIVVFPELCITGYSCGDLFGQKLLLDRAKQGLLELAQESLSYDAIFFVGLPFIYQGKLYNTAAAISGGKVLGLIPKKALPDYHEFYEVRQFTEGFLSVHTVQLSENESTYIGIQQLFCPVGMEELMIGVEICEDLWTPLSPSTIHALAGANVIVNLSASDEITAKSAYRRSLVEATSARLYCGYIYASAGCGESTQDVVYSGHNLIAESGTILEESSLFTEGMICSEIDIDKISSERRRMNTYCNPLPSIVSVEDYQIQWFLLQRTETQITRYIDPAPFVPSEEASLFERCEEILQIQSMGLVKRLQHTHAKTVVLGISGGLDSTLALIVCARAFDILHLDHQGIYAVTMPGFGTTDRTYQNAVAMIHAFGATFREIPIAQAVHQHFSDISQDENQRDVTYENSQARERTQILMDLANQQGGLVIGTGDLSELALGWATYNGDHMSMYGVNVSVPKTLVRHLVSFYARQWCHEREELRQVLFDVLETPVSPELLPPMDGVISQKTEELVGPYELHDFYLYYFMRFGFKPSKIYRLALLAFEGTYEEETILKWLKIFCKRFFAQQFKRSCLPDGPKVGSVALSPRGDWRMPSDASAALWEQDLAELKSYQSYSLS